MFDLLKGIRVVEATLLINGGGVGMLLADLGADVVKVEPPKGGDYIRDYLGQIAPHYSPMAMQMHKGKRSIGLDLRSADGRAVLAKLVSGADVFVTNFLPAACRKIGIDFEAIRAIKPDIVYATCTGFGAVGPYASIPTHGRLMNAAAANIPIEMGEDGFVKLRFADDLMGGTSRSAEGPVAGSMFTALAVAAALQRRQRTGEATHIDVAGSDAVVAASWIGATYNANRHRVTDWTGMSGERLKHPDQEVEGSSRYQFYRTADDRFVYFGCLEKKFFDAFADAVDRPDLKDLGRPELLNDFGYNSDAERRVLQGIFETRSQAAWVDLAITHDLAIGPAHRFDDLQDDPQMRARGTFHTAMHPVAGEFTYVSFPALVDGKTYDVDRHAPNLGEHTRDILAEIGMDGAATDRLFAAGVVV